MHYLALAALLTAVMAAPADNAAQALLCPIGLYSVPQCCSTDVLGIACLDATTQLFRLHCTNISSSAATGNPRNGYEFRQACAWVGQQARCCVVPILGQDLLCVRPL
ncbi:hypothetical protein V492_05860 [Pseudogymnoascus sp. VKM F-4246]|nr:hypothetical protein V492_05860 [Pseudogymnoascus sp. VKM F-4246]